MASTGAFASRNVVIAGVSPDEPNDSAKFAAKYEIAYPLISDRDQAIARALVGVDVADNTIPGVVIIRRDGAIVFRQIATSKDDRLTARQLLDAIDRTLGTTGALVESRQPAFERVQLRVEAGGGAVRVGSEYRETAVARLSVTLPLTRYLIAGTGLAADIDQALSLRSSLGVRIPLLADLAAIQLSAEAGLPLDAPGVYAGARLGLWYAQNPRLAFQLDGSFGAYDVGSVDQRPGFAVTFGIARLIGR